MGSDGMAGKAKYAAQMAKHVGTAVDAACPITRPGGTAGQIGMNVGGLAGAALGGLGSKTPTDLNIGQFAWLGLDPQQLTITKASLMGKPTGDPIAQIAYADVDEVVLTEGKLTLRVDLGLTDGRVVAFEAKRHGQNKPSVEVLELLRDRCGGS